MKFLLPFLLCLSSHAAQWNVGFFRYADDSYVQEVATNGAFEFRTWDLASTDYLAGPLTTTDANLTYSLAGKVITATVSLVEAGDPQYVWRAWDTWNKLPYPAHFRFFISLYTNTLNIAQSNGDQLAFWWSGEAFIRIGTNDVALGEVVPLDLISQLGTVTITTSFTNQWSAAHGQSSFVETSAFNYALENAKQIGLTCGGGSFPDVGVATRLGTGTATFVLEDFRVRYPVREFRK